MRACDIARDGKPKTHAAFLQIATFIEPVKRPECFFSTVLRNTGTVVVDEYLDEAPILLQRDIDMRPMLERIVDNVCRAAS